MSRGNETKIVIVKKKSGVFVLGVIPTRRLEIKGPGFREIKAAFGGALPRNAIDFEVKGGLGERFHPMPKVFLLSAPAFGFYPLFDRNTGKVLPNMGCLERGLKFFVFGGEDETWSWAEFEGRYNVSTTIGYVFLKTLCIKSIDVIPEMKTFKWKLEKELVVKMVTLKKDMRLSLVGGPGEGHLGTICGEFERPIVVEHANEHCFLLSREGFYFATIPIIEAIKSEHVDIMLE